MVSEREIKGKKYFFCSICGLAYLDRETAEKCEDWCGKHNSCNVEIIRKSVKPE